MLNKVTKIEIFEEYCNYGKIKIPQYASVGYDKNLNEDDRKFHLLPGKWIDKDYPEIATELKARLERERLYISPEKLIYMFRVKYWDSEIGYCQDFFKNEHGHLICRMPYNSEYACWYTITKEYEACGPLRTDLLIQIMDKDNQIVLNEQQNKEEREFWTPKLFPYSWEKPETIEQQAIYDKIYK